MIKKQINQLLQKEMDRKDFLKHVGVAAIAVVGVPAVLKTLGQFGGGSSNQQGSSVGYGASAYGGAAAPRTAR